jgi:hypothetical protein
MCTNFSSSQELQEIVKKHMLALGGEENVAHIKTLFGRANISMAGFQGEMRAWWGEPDKSRQEFYFPVLEQLIVTDAEDFWMEDESGGARKLGEGKWMELLNEVFLDNYEYLFSQTKGGIVNFLVGTTEKDPRDLVLEFVSKNGEPTKLFIDDRTFLTHKYQRFTDQESVTVRLSDYREVGGVMFPFRMHRTRRSPRSDTFVEFVEIAMNLPLPEALFVKPEGVSKDYRFVSSTGHIDVPFELVSNHIYIKVRINEFPALSFLLDTGAQLSYLDLSKANELGIRETGAEEVRRIGSCEDLSFFKLDSVKISSTNSSPDESSFAQNDDMTLFKQIMAGIALSQVEKFDGKEIDGVLGYDFLRRFVVEIDYVNRILTFYEPKDFKYKGNGESIKMGLEWYIPTLKATIDGECEGIFKIDTGSRNNLDLYAPFVKAHKFLEKYPNYVETLVGFGITGPAKGVVGRIGSLGLGSFVLDSPVTGCYLEDRSSLSSSKAAGKIGGGILKRFKVIFDYPRYRMILEKNTNYHLRDRYNSSGIQLIQEGEKISVFHVIENSVAEKAKIIKGDELLSIYDIPVSSYSLQMIKEILNQEEGTTIELSLRRKEEVKNVNLILKDVI